MSLSVRKVNPVDTTTIHDIVRNGYISHVSTLFKAALHNGKDLHIRAMVFSGFVVFLLKISGAQPLPSFLFGSVAYMFTMLLAWVYAYVCMIKESQAATSKELANPAGYYDERMSGKGSYFWVVEEEVPTTSPHVENHVEQDEQVGRVIGFVGLQRISSTEAQLQHLNVVKMHQGKGIATTLLKHLFKHANANGFKTVVARMSSAQRAAKHVLLKAGFKVVSEKKVNSWFSVLQLEVDIKHLK